MKVRPQFTDKKTEGQRETCQDHSLVRGEPECGSGLTQGPGLLCYNLPRRSQKNVKKENNAPLGSNQECHLEKASGRTQNYPGHLDGLRFSEVT